MSALLALVASSQLVLLVTFVHYRSRRVLEFAQPSFICVLVSAGIVSTSSCYLYLYLSDLGCALRGPLIYLSSTLMGSSLSGRAWRISVLMRDPLSSSSSRGGGGGDDDRAVKCWGAGGGINIERMRQLALLTMSAMSSSMCDGRTLGNLTGGGGGRGSRGGGGGGRPVRIKITNGQVMRVTSILCLPQLFLQLIIAGVPYTRSTLRVANHDVYGIDVSDYECRSHAGEGGRYWSTFASVLFAALPYCCAYLLNIRPKKEREELPDIIDERRQLGGAFWVVVRVLVITIPIIVMSEHYYAMAIRTYATICQVLGLSISLCYYIGFLKLSTLRSNGTNSTGQYNYGAGGQLRGRSSAGYAVKMAQMYATIGRTEETLELIDDTLDGWKRGSRGGILVNQDATEDIGCGFTKNDLKNLEQDELEMVIQLLIIKGDALMKINGLAGFPMSAEINISAMRIFENCPASKKMKDISVMFPIYNRVALQLKGGVIAQDEACSLEMDLAERFCHEAQVQSYHFARALGHLAEWYGRIGSIENAFKYFDIMAAVYMPIEHPSRITAAYAVDRCAVTYAVSCLWHLQMGDAEKAIQRCEQVIEEILPSYDKNDSIGTYQILWPIIRVLKWNGRVDRARDVYNQWVPAGIESHFSVGCLHKPMCLLLKICDGSSVEYNTEDMEADIGTALTFDMGDFGDLILVCDGWSAKTLAAELCLHLARRLEPGNSSRERLIERGIVMSAMAMARTTTSNGMIKHILAYDAHKGIDDRLLELRKQDNAVIKRSVYDGNESIMRSLPTDIKVNGFLNGPKKISDGELDFASRFTVKSETFSSTGSASSTQMRKVTFSKSSKGSRESNGLAPKSSSSKNDTHSDKSVGDDVSECSQLSPNPALHANKRLSANVS
ncbi:hypothetical protein ACHAXA_002852 [Cyclostephanos tholiformis]|uniref:G-protein coupled receptors family 3 profile domain-containing protein n=1 Tax=Cyclostephanos tholiformis TaxID=382380 RepID=A0ABD3RBL8_9STRA